MTPHLIAIFAATLLFAPHIAVTPLVHSSSTTARSSAQDMDFTLQGKITTLAGGKITVSTEENIIFHVRFDDKTDIKKKDGSPGAGSDLRVGLMIGVAGNLEESGEIAAKKIDIQSDAPPKK
jgi:hypothetical protein